MESILTKNQTKTMSKVIGNERLSVVIRYDDECNNGHNSFAITATLSEKIPYKTKYTTWRKVSWGCQHDEVKRFFPELEPYLKWHLCSSDGPMHYTANTLYFASDKDYNGLRKGEKRQIINGRTKLPSWILATIDENGEEVKPDRYLDSETEPTITYTTKYIPWCRIGEGKEPELELARSSAIWPDATIEQLQDKDLLLARLPKLLQEFKEAVESLGFVY